MTMDMGMRGLANCKVHFLAPHPSTFGLFGNAAINLVLNVAFFSCFHTGNKHHTWGTFQVNDILCDGLISRNCIFKENHTFRKILPSKCNLTLWTPLQNSTGPEVTYWKIPIFHVSGKCNFIYQAHTHPK